MKKKYYNKIENILEPHNQQKWISQQERNKAHSPFENSINKALLQRFPLCIVVWFHFSSLMATCCFGACSSLAFSTSSSKPEDKISRRRMSCVLPLQRRSFLMKSSNGHPLNAVSFQDGEFLSCNIGTYVLMFGFGCLCCIICCGWKEIETQLRHSTLDVVQRYCNFSNQIEIFHSFDCMIILMFSWCFLFPLDWDSVSFYWVIISMFGLRFLCYMM